MSSTFSTELQRKQVVTQLGLLGLSDRAASIYVHVLENGPATILELARLTATPRTTLYPTIDELIENRLLYREAFGVKSKFVASSPAILHGLIAEKQALLTELIPKLSQLGTHKQSRVAVEKYDGLASVKGAYLKMLDGIKENQHYLIVSHESKWMSRAPDFWKKFVHRRRQLDLTVKMLLADEPASRKLVNLPILHREEIRLFSAEEDLLVNGVVCEDRVLLHQLQDRDVGILIRSKPVAALFRSLFRLAWSASAPKR